MKRQSIIFLFLLAHVAAMGQYKPIEQIFDRYAGKEGYTSVVITRQMFSLISEIEVAKDDEYMKMIQNLNGIRILTCTQTPALCKAFYDEVLAAVDHKVFEELMDIQNSDERIKFMVRKKDGKVTDLVVLTGGNTENALIWITGIIDMKSIGKLTRDLNLGEIKE